MLISSSKNFIFVPSSRQRAPPVSNLFLPYARFIEKATYKCFLTKKLVAIYARIFNLENQGQEFITGYHKHATAGQIIERMGLENYKEKIFFLLRSKSI